MKKIARRIISIWVIIGILLCGTGCGNKKYVHFSLDDATQILQEIYFCGYSSIFEQPILATLQEYHETYGLTCSLFLYEQSGDFSLSLFPETYKKEFEENSDWLKLGFHALNDEDPATSDVSDLERIESFNRTKAEVIRFAGENAWTNSMRLHFWYAPREVVNELEKAGVKTLFCPDSEINGYDLSEEELLRLHQSRNEVISLRGMKYCSTDIRLENTDNMQEALQEHASDDVIVVFSHAWCFLENADKLDDLCTWSASNGYQYSFLEKREGIR